jgi:GLPGLI family protein
MKNLSIYFLLCISISGFAQQKTYTQAIIYTTTNIIAPDDEIIEMNQNGQESSRGGFNFRNMMDGETKFVTYIKNDLTKTLIKSEVTKSSIFRDELIKKTTTIMQMMGNTFGFYITDNDALEMQRKQDSIFAERRKKDTTNRVNSYFPDRKKSTVEIIETDEIKKIAGFNCKKAYLVTTKFLDNKDTTTLWYTPSIKFQNIHFTGSISGMPGMNFGLNGIDKIDGFVMKYESKLRRGRKLEVEVNKIELDKEINDKEFLIPQDVEIKPMSEMQNMFGGGRGGFMRGRD